MGSVCAPFTGADLMSVGCLNFGGLSFGNTDLRDVSRVAVAVGGDITGDISAGAVRRVQARGRFEEVGNPPELEYVGGKITGNITATTYNRSFVGGGGGYNAIGAIWAGDEVSGVISCTNDDDFNPGGLTWLIVGREGNTAIDGLLGDVRIDYGLIEKIHTAGPIGSATLTPKIWAGRTITEIRAIDAAELGNTDPSTVAALDFKADIRSGLYIGDVSAPRPYDEDGPVHLIETDGNLTGSVNIANLTYFSTNSTRQSGIIVGGAITAPINIRYNLEIADIIAASIDAPITVGCSAKGAIVATSSNGQIHSVEIGYANDGLTDQDPGYDPVAARYFGVYPRGFKGSDCAPVNPDFAPPYDVYTQADWTAVVPHCSGMTQLFDSGSTDSVIRAPYIGSVRLFAMTDRYNINDRKDFFPRVESPEIGSLEIGLLRNGVVWSGNLTMDNGNLVWDPEEAYSSVGQVNIGCIDRAGDLWLDGASRITIAQDVLGQIHLPSLTDTLWIGGSLDLWSGLSHSCANGIGSDNLNDFNSEDSPRDTLWTGEEPAARGEVIIREQGGLQGQIIINGNNAGEQWNGAVIVGDELGANRIVLTPDSQDPAFDAPYYTSPSTPLGGGAVGLVPFHFYPEDCSVLNHDYLLMSSYSTSNPIYLAFYGPVAADNPAKPLAVIEYHRPYQAYDDDLAPPTDNWAEADNVCTIAVSPNPRKLRVTPHSDKPKMPGEYRLRTDPVVPPPHDDPFTDLPNLVCDDVPSSPLASAAEHWFWLTLDCNGINGADSEDFLDPDEGWDPKEDCDRNLIDDCCDINVGGAGGDPETCELSGKCVTDDECGCDWNVDTILNSQDFFDFIADFFDGDADFNEDMATNSQDFFDFLTCFFAGCP